MTWHDLGYDGQQIAIWVLVVVLGALVVLGIWPERSANNGRVGETPEQIVKRRYAAGEIDRETYERMLLDLEHRPASQNRWPPETS